MRSGPWSFCAALVRLSEFQGLRKRVCVAGAPVLSTFLPVSL